MLGDNVTKKEFLKRAKTASENLLNDQNVKGTGDDPSHHRTSQKRRLISQAILLISNTMAQIIKADVVGHFLLIFLMPRSTPSITNDMVMDGVNRGI